MAGSTPPPIQGPSSKEKKYDRQLRLWGANGQAALEDAHILLINGSGPGVIGTETLKNLVLPGIGQYTILDSAVVADADLGVSFFLEESSKGGSRAEQTCRYLQELNPDVKGHSIAETVEEFLEKPSSLDPYTFILANAPLSPAILSQLSEHASKTRVPLFYIRSIGFYASFAMSLPPDFPVVDTHPDPATTSDLRLLKPWPELTQLAEKKTAGLDDMSNHDHGHVPYVLLLMHYLKQWTAEHGQPPKDYKEKTEFRSMVASAARTSNPEGGEENYDEAVGAVLKALNPPSASSAVRDIFAAPECKNLTASSATFWVIAAAIAAFYEEYEVLPLSGAVPDMKAQSSDYIELQNIYKQKARRDVADVLARVRKLEKDSNRSPPVDEKEVEAFCRNAATIKLVRGRPLQLARADDDNDGKDFNWGDQAANIAMTLYYPNPPLPLYLALLASDAFHARHGHLPGTTGDTDADIAADAATVTTTATNLLDSLLAASGLAGALDPDQEADARTQLADACGELARAAGAELHNTAALAGGLVAQEVIKVVTSQYVPVDNVAVWDGVASCLGVLRV